MIFHESCLPAFVIFEKSANLQQIIGGTFRLNLMYAG